MHSTQLRDKKNVGIQVLSIILIILLGATYINELKNIEVINDEFGYWGSAAFFSGYDWSGLMESAPYYSYGYGFLLVLIMKLCTNAVSMYRVAIFLNILLLCICYLLAVKCWKMLFKCRNNIWDNVVPLVIVLYSNTLVQSQIAWSETLLYFLFWLIFYLVLLDLRCEKIFNSCLLSGVLILCTIYMYTVHQRSLGVLISVVAFVIYKIWSLNGKKEWKIILTIVFLGLTALLFMMTGEIKIALKNELWVNGQYSTQNDYSAMMANAGNLFTMDGILYLIKSVLGKIYYILNATLFIGGFGAIFILKGCWKFIKEKCSIKNSYYVYALFSIGLTLAIDAYAMMGSYRLDVPVYGRYFELAIGPLLMFGMGYALRNIKNIKWEIVFLLIVDVIGAFVVDNLYETSATNTFNGYCAVGIYKFFSPGFNKESISFKIAFICITLSVAYLLILKYSKSNVVSNMAFILIVCGFWFSNSSEIMDKLILDWQTTIEENLGQVTETIINEYDGKKIYIIQPDSELYVDDYYFKQMQFKLFEYEICRIEKDEILNENYDENALYLLPRGSGIYGEIQDEFHIIEESGYLALLEPIKKG